MPHIDMNDSDDDAKQGGGAGFSGTGHATGTRERPIRSWRVPFSEHPYDGCTCHGHGGVQPYL
jgi:hypothetical protein